MRHNGLVLDLSLRCVVDMIRHNGLVLDLSLRCVLDMMKHNGLVFDLSLRCVLDMMRHSKCTSPFVVFVRLCNLQQQLDASISLISDDNNDLMGWDHSHDMD